MLKVHAQKSQNTTIFRLWGRISIDQTTTLRHTLLSTTHTDAVVLDMGRVNGIDASGLGLMVELREHFQSKGIEFRLVNVPALVQQVLEIARLDTVLEVSAESAKLSGVSRNRRPPDADTSSGAWRVH